MAVKQSYKIPAHLDQSYGDMELSIKSNDGVGVKPLPIKVILSYVVSIIGLFVVVSKTVIGQGHPLQIGLFVILWAALTFLLVSIDKTKRMNATLIPVLLNYLPTRLLLTRTSSAANAFRALVGIDIIDKNGCVHFLDGSFGYWYRVVGTASVLLFDDDKNAIINRVDTFYRKLGVDCELIFMTSKESQKVYSQIANLKRRFDALPADMKSDPDMIKMADEQLHVLRDDVGGKFKSIHQYMIVKADNEEALSSNKNVVQSEVENSSLMIKQCIPMYEDDIDMALASIYK